MSVSEGIPTTSSSESSELDVHYPVTVTIYFDQSATNQKQNSSCSSDPVILDSNAAGPSVFTHPAFTECGELIKRIEVLYLTDSTLEEHQNPFINLPHLKELVIKGLDISRLTKDFFSGVPEVEDLHLGGNIRKIDPDAFTGMPNLKTLRLLYISLEESLESIKSLSNLEELKVEGSDISNLNALKGLPKLKHLSLGYRSMSRFNVAELKKNLPNLTRVDMFGDPFDPEFEKELNKDELFNVLHPSDITPY